MQALVMDLHANTPTVTVFSNRSQAVREVAYHRHPGTPTATDTRITRHQYDPRGFLTRSQDPRLFAADLANFTWLADLAGTAVRTQGVDPGISLDLNDIAGRPLLAVSQIAPGPDGDDHSQAVTRTWRHEPPTLPGRLLAITEQVSGEPVRQAERFIYAGADLTARQRNLAGRCSHHYDTAGLLRTDSLALTGPALASLRRLLKVADDVGLMSDWQGDDASVWETQLVPEGEGHLTVGTLDATGTRLSSIDAAGHGQRAAYDVAGQLRGSWLELKGTAEQVIVTSLSYAATGEKLEEVHGNGVVTRYTREPRTQRLAGIRTEGSGTRVLQDLHYTYDPVGNVLGRVDEALAITYWRNQKVEPRNSYEYDSLYQLASAKGREMAGVGRLGVFNTFDYATYTNYTRLYTYDTAGNLTRIEHQADAGGNSHTTDITVSDRSNRAVTSELASGAADVEALFTAGGQQKQLFPGQHLAWTPRAELLQVKPVTREGEPDDHEGYRYAGDSQRLLKVSAQKTSGGERTQRVVYLPGLERRHRVTTGGAAEDLQVICMGQAGRAQVRILHWVTGKPPEIGNDQLRFSYDDLLGSGVLELDGQGEVISQEEYFPFGGTAVFSARSEAEGRYKVLRYSGKERDATGLYYYGYRYYQPWVGRWLSVDPAGTVDGLNLFAMVINNPVTGVDEQGLMLSGKVPGKPEGTSGQSGSRMPGTQAVTKQGQPVAGSSKSTQSGPDDHGADDGFSVVGSRKPPKTSKQGEASNRGGSYAIGSKSSDKVVFENLREQVPREANVRSSDVLAVAKRPNADGRGSKILFLSAGDDNKGFKHVLRHRNSFEKVGVKGDEEIKELVVHALANGREVDVQNPFNKNVNVNGETGRPVYEVEFKGKVQRVAITTGRHGIIVGANPNDPSYALNQSNINRRPNPPPGQRPGRANFR